MAAQWSKLPESPSPPPAPPMDPVRHVDRAISLDDWSSLLPSYVSERRESKLVPLRKRVVLSKIDTFDFEMCPRDTAKAPRM